MSLPGSNRRLALAFFTWPPVLNLLALTESTDFFSKTRAELEEQRKILSAFAIHTTISKNDENILFKAQYYLHRLSRIIYEDKIGPALLRLNEAQNAFNELYERAESPQLRALYERTMELVSVVQSRLSTM